MAPATRRYPLWTRGDLDGFFGLMVDNLAQVLVIIALCIQAVGMPAEFVFTRILPGVGVSLIIGNVFYAWQARRLARRTGRSDITALPYGINTPSVIAFIFFIMLPVYQTSYVAAVEAGLEATEAATRAAERAWLAGVAACLVSGLIEFFGAFVAEKIRRATPRAALLGVLAAVGVTFIASDFAFRIFAQPMVALIPLGLILITYFGRFRVPWNIPGGFIAILIGTVIAWGLTLTGTTEFGGDPSLSVAAVRDAAGWLTWTPPTYYGAELMALLQDRDLVLRFLAISIPMGLLNLIGALQNIESAEAAGDRFRTGPSLAMNGIGSIAAGLFGSCFPTTIYIGHPAWKAMGARAGYSVANGVFFSLCFLFGLGALLGATIPISAGAAIVMYIGIIITAQAFQATPRAHAPAVAIAFFPALAALLVFKTLDFSTITAGALSLEALLMSDAKETAIMPGLLTLTGANSSWILLTLFLTAFGAALVDHRYRAAAVWMGLTTVLTATGLLHAYQVDGNIIAALFIWQTPADGAIGFRAYEMMIGYAVITGLVLLADRVQRQRLGTSAAEEHAATRSAAPRPGPSDSPDTPDITR